MKKIIKTLLACMMGVLLAPSQAMKEYYKIEGDAYKMSNSFPGNREFLDTISEITRKVNCKFLTNQMPSDEEFNKARSALTDLMLRKQS